MPGTGRPTPTRQQQQDPVRWADKCSTLIGAPACSFRTAGDRWKVKAVDGRWQAGRRRRQERPLSRTNGGSIKLGGVARHGTARRHRPSTPGGGNRAGHASHDSSLSEDTAPRARAFPRARTVQTRADLPPSAKRTPPSHSGL